MAQVSDQDLIRRLGGTGAAAKEFGISAAAVSQWRRKGRIPPLRRELLELRRPDLFRPESANQTDQQAAPA